jgi:hypothetical protein
MITQRIKILIIPVIYSFIFIFYESVVNIFKFLFSKVSIKLYTYIYHDYDVSFLDTFIIDLYLYWSFISLILFFLYYLNINKFLNIGIKLTFIFHLFLLFYLIYHSHPKV